MSARRLQALLSPRHFRRCRKLFRAPLRAHVRLAGVGAKSFELRCRDGSVIPVPDYRPLRPMLRFLMSERMGGGAVSGADGLLRIAFEGHSIAIRPTRGDFYNFTEIFLEDDYRIAALPERIGTVVDLGGHVGLFTTRVASRAERVVTVEPMPENRRIARINFAPFGDRIRLRPWAISDTSGARKRFHLSPDAPSMHSEYASIGHQHGAAGGTGEVETISLPDLLAREAVETCDLLKCDVEGSEYAALLATPLDVLQRIERIAMEVHRGVEPGGGDRWPELRRHLEAAGFRCTLDGDENAAGDLPTVFMLHAAREG